MSAARDDEVFGSDAQKQVLTRGRALFEVLKDDPRYSCHGRTVGLVSPGTGSMDLLSHLARIQGASHYANLSPDEESFVKDGLEKRGLSVVNYARWEISQDGLDQARASADAVPLSAGLTLQQLNPEHAPHIIDGFAKNSLQCGVLPAWRSAHMGQTLRACTLVAVTQEGKVAASAYATSYITGDAPLARSECFWGMLATNPDWRGAGLSILLGGALLDRMHRDFGFTDFYTGVEPGNAASEAVCYKLGLRAKGNRIFTVADPEQLPGGRMTK